MKTGLKGIMDATPIALSFLLFGGIFGVLSLQVGMTPLHSVAMSFLVHAGSAQFAVLPMLTDGADFWAMVLVTFLMNSRHFLMGMSLAPYYAPLTRNNANVAAFFMSDEQYALTLNHIRRSGFDKNYVFTVSIFLHVFWALGTFLGTVVGHWLPDPQGLGLEFSFTAMFLALAYDQVGSVSRLSTFLICGGVAILLSLWSANGLHVLGAGLIAFAVGYLRPVSSENAVEKETKGKEGITA